VRLDEAVASQLQDAIPGLFVFSNSMFPPCKLPPDFTAAPEPDAGAGAAGAAGAVGAQAGAAAAGQLSGGAEPASGAASSGMSDDASSDCLSEAGTGQQAAAGAGASSSRPGGAGPSSSRTLAAAAAAAAGSSYNPRAYVDDVAEDDDALTSDGDDGDARGVDGEGAEAADAQHALLMEELRSNNRRIEEALVDLVGGDGRARRAYMAAEG
jgi:hypothetical protein